MSLIFYISAIFIRYLIRYMCNIIKYHTYISHILYTYQIFNMHLIASILISKNHFYVQEKLLNRSNFHSHYDKSSKEYYHINWSAFSNY